MSYNWRDRETATKKELLSDIAYAEICFHTHYDYVGDIKAKKDLLEWSYKTITRGINNRV